LASQEVIEFRGIREVNTPQASHLSLRRMLSFGRLLAFGQDLLADDNDSKLLTANDLALLRRARLHIRKSERGYYPEVVSGTVWLNRVVDALVVGLAKKPVEERWRVVRKQNQTRRTRAHKLVREFCAFVDEQRVAVRLKAIAVRGQLANPRRIFESDIDLLILCDSESVYGELCEACLEFVRERCDDLVGLTFLGTDFDRSDARSNTMKAGTTGILDIYATVPEKELRRALYCDPVESFWNLAILREARAIWRKVQYGDFVRSFATARQIQAKSVGYIPPQKRRRVPLTHADLTLACERGVAALVRAFPVIALWERGSNSGGQSFFSPFVAAAICEAICEAGVDKTAVLQRQIRYLLESMEDGGLWRFSSEKREWPLDVDDTACALAALQRIGIGIPEPKTILNWLLPTQTAGDGLLRTWIEPRRGSRDGINETDAIVTANALLLAERVGTPAESLALGLYQHLEHRGLTRASSLYYNSPALRAYYIVRWAVASPKSVARKTERLVNSLLAGKGITTLNPAELAAYVSTVARLGDHQHLLRLLPLLLAWQDDQGRWPIAQCFVDPGGGIYGSAELSTALAVEALSLGRRLLSDRSS
jgi:hypothetical protein